MVIKLNKFLSMEPHHEPLFSDGHTQKKFFLDLPSGF